MLIGVQRSSSDLLAFLDDDIRVNKWTLRSLAQGLRQGVGVTTGYSVEVPSVRALTSYLVMVYRAINLLGFTNEQVNYCWGGCFCCSRGTYEELRMREIWTDGCYSDDMVFGDVLKRAGLRIAAPETNMFVNRINCNSFWR